jgi:hypothetical protein
MQTLEFHGHLVIPLGFSYLPNCKPSIYDLWLYDDIESDFTYLWRFIFFSVLTVAKSRRIIVCAKTQVGFWAYAARVGSCGSTGF